MTIEYRANVKYHFAGFWLLVLFFSFTKSMYSYSEFNIKRDIDSILSREPNNDSQKSKQKTVNCLPECEHFDYPVEVAMGKLAKNIRLAGIPFFNNMDLTNRSLLNVFFNDLVSTRFRRDVYLNWENILAAFGGLLSLMLGFTLISGFDIILFFSLQVLYQSLPEYFSQNKRLPTKKSTKIDDKKVNTWMEKTQFPVDKDRRIWSPAKIRRY